MGTLKRITADELAQAGYVLDGEPTMSKGQLEEIRALLKQKAKFSVSVIEQRKAEILADIETKLASVYRDDDRRFVDLTAAANKAVAAADAEIAQRCRDLEIPEAFRPGLELAWRRRGENASKERRKELREAAEKRVEAMAKKAEVEVQHRVLAGQTLLTEAVVDGTRARALLDGILSIETLMPMLELAVLESLVALPDRRDDEW